MNKIIIIIKMMIVISYLAFICFILRIYLKFKNINEKKIFFDSLLIILLIFVIIFVLEYCDFMNHQFILITLFTYIMLNIFDIKTKNKINVMKCPNYPQEISREDIIEYVKLVFIELNKFSGDNFKKCFEERDQCNNYDYQNDHIIADQGDALIDIDYYSRNIACLFGIDLSYEYYEKFDNEFIDENNNLIEDDDINFSKYVKIFTEESKNIKCPEYPEEITHDKVLFLTKMIISEIDELVATISHNEVDKKFIMEDILDSHNNLYYEIIDDPLENQIDCLIKIYHLSKNLAYSHGINLSKIFHEVHSANLRKKDPQTNKYIIRESDGKIMKPLNWKAPDINSIIRDQLINGSWN